MDFYDNGNEVEKAPELKHCRQFAKIVTVVQTRNRQLKEGGGQGHLSFNCEKNLQNLCVAKRDNERKIEREAQ